jgi:hypothetical protein
LGPGDEHSFARLGPHIIQMYVPVTPTLQESAMRSRDRVLQSLEKVYRDAFASAEASGNEQEMSRLDLEYQRDQLQLEILLDIRELLTPQDAPEDTTSLLEKAQKLRKFTKLR